MWSTMDHTFADYDELLVQHVTGLKPGRALDLGMRLRRKRRMAGPTRLASDRG